MGWASELRCEQTFTVYRSLCKRGSRMAESNGNSVYGAKMSGRFGKSGKENGERTREEWTTCRWFRRRKERREYIIMRQRGMDDHDVSRGTWLKIIHLEWVCFERKSLITQIISLDINLIWGWTRSFSVKRFDDNHIFCHSLQSSDHCVIRTHLIWYFDCFICEDILCMDCLKSDVVPLYMIIPLSDVPSPRFPCDSNSLWSNCIRSNFNRCLLWYCNMIIITS